MTKDQLLKQIQNDPLWFELRAEGNDHGFRTNGEENLGGEQYEGCINLYVYCEKDGELVGEGWIVIELQTKEPVVYGIDWFKEKDDYDETPYHYLTRS